MLAAENDELSGFEVKMLKIETPEGTQRSLRLLCPVWWKSSASVFLGRYDAIKIVLL